MTKAATAGAAVVRFAFISRCPSTLSELTDLEPLPSRPRGRSVKGIASVARHHPTDDHVSTRQIAQNSLRFFTGGYHRLGSRG
jgi:hypothetical protein